MLFGNSAGNFGGLAVRLPFEHDSAAGMSKLVALLANFSKLSIIGRKRCRSPSLLR